MKSDEMFCLILFIIVILLTTAVFWLRLLQSLSIFFNMLSNSPKVSLNFNSKFNLIASWVWSRLKMGLLAWFCSLLLMQNDRNLPKPWMKLYGRAKKNWTRVFGLTSILYSFNSFENEMNYSLRSTLVVINFKLRYTCHERFCKDQFEVG